MTLTQVDYDTKSASFTLHITSQTIFLSPGGHNWKGGGGVGVIFFTTTVVSREKSNLSNRLTYLWTDLSVRISVRMVRSRVRFMIRFCDKFINGHK